MATNYLLLPADADSVKANLKSVAPRVLNKQPQDITESDLIRIGKIAVFLNKSPLDLTTEDYFKYRAVEKTVQGDDQNVDMTNIDFISKLAALINKDDVNKVTPEDVIAFEKSLSVEDAVIASNDEVKHMSIIEDSNLGDEDAVVASNDEVKATSVVENGNLVNENTVEHTEL